MRERETRDEKNDVNTTESVGFCVFRVRRLLKRKKLLSLLLFLVCSCCVSFRGEFVELFGVVTEEKKTEHFYNISHLSLFLSFSLSLSIYLRAIMLFLRVLRILVLLFFEKGEDFRVHQHRRSLTAENVVVTHVARNRVSVGVSHFGHIITFYAARV